MNMLSDKSLDASIRQFKLQYFLSTFALNFFATLYLFAGIGMLLVSFYLESEVFLTLLGEEPLISYLTAGCLEAMKLGTIIVYDFIGRRQPTQPEVIGYGHQIKTTAQLLFKRFFQMSLFIISMLCVATVISKRFDNPNISQVRNEDTAVLEKDYQSEKSAIETRLQREREDLAAHQQQVMAGIQFRYQTSITEKRAIMDRTRRDIRRRMPGAVERYAVYEQQLAELESQQSAAIDTQRNLAGQQLMELNQHHGQKLTKLDEQFKSKREQIRHSEYGQDFRVVHPEVKAIVKTVNAVLSVSGSAMRMEGTTFVALFALMLSAIIECGIFLALSSFVAVFCPQEFAAIELEMAEAQKKTSRYGFTPDDT